MRSFLMALLSLAFLHSTAIAAEARENEKLDAHIISLLLAQNFNELEKLLNGIQKSYEDDFRKEEQADVAFHAFSRVRPEFEPLLNKWIKVKPKSYVAHTARGVYYTQNGWFQRGAYFIKDTSKQQIQGMRRYFRKALADFEKARALNGNMLHPICYQMEILMHASDDEKIRELHQEALKINPLSLTARWSYITTLLPRWGGALWQIGKEIEAARPYHARNPALKVLEGRVSAELGDQALFSREYEKAEGLLTEALKSGNHWYYYRQRAEAYHYTRQAKRLEGDITAALSLRPNQHRMLFLKASVLYGEEKMEEAIAAYGKVLEDNPYDHEALMMRSFSYKKLGELPLALSDIEKAIALDPSDTNYPIDRESILSMMKWRTRK